MCTLSGARRRHGAGILTGFPFGPDPFGGPLGPANSWLRAHSQENLALPAAGVFTRLGCYYRQDLQRRPVHGTSRPRFYPASAPTYRLPLLSRGNPRSRRPA